LAQRSASEKEKSEGKKSSSEGEPSFGESMKYNKNSAVLPLKVEASSWNPINWDPRLIRSSRAVKKMTR
jgi:hypothetical protein